MSKRKSDYGLCKYCNGVLKFHDHAKRTIRGKYGVKTMIRIERTICTSCGRIRHVYPEYMLPYKQYEKEIIEGVKEGLITCETLGYEDYPCELTMKHWSEA